ncbi:MAG: hypothetical protein HYY03_06885, partial [Chloroflexi bacterium]|nr:hypothetical protein [Chloroflexota bacterium]
RQARGIPLINLISLEQKERITAVVRCPPEMEHDYMLMATKLGEAKKTPLQNFASVRRDGLIAMDLEPADELVAAKLASDADRAIIVTARGQALRFTVGSLRSASRHSGGVRGVKLAAGDAVVGMDIARPGEALLVVSALGHGKRTPVEEYPLQARGGQGVITFKTHAKSGDLIAARVVNAAHELMLISEDGIVLRTPVAHISLQGRPTQGVILMDVGEGDRVAAVAVIDMQREFAAPQPLPTGATVERREPAPRGKTRDKTPAKGGKAKPAAKAVATAKARGKAPDKVPQPAKLPPAAKALQTAKRPPTAKGPGRAPRRRA